MKKIVMGIVACTIMAGCNVKERKQTEQTPEGKEIVVATIRQEAPDFTLNDQNGMALSLSNLRGQYVVLDFWGVWCKWCVKGIPDMKAYYEKYEGKFEILSIDFNDSEEEWRNAIESYDMEWLHVITDEESAEYLAHTYNIEGFPTKIIVDPQGKIEHITVGEDPEFYQYLDDLFGSK